MIDDMDINAGFILDGVPVDEVGAQIFEELLLVAGGKPTKSESIGLGDLEFAPWSVGSVLWARRQTGLKQAPGCARVATRPPG